MVEYSLKSKLYLNFIFLFILILNIQEFICDSYPIYEGESKTVYFYNAKNLMICFQKFPASKFPILIHFLPIDCEIKIGNDDIPQSIDIKKINNYNYDAFSLFTNNYNYTCLNIYNLINSSKKHIQLYPLTINRIKFINPDIPILNAKENVPVFLYFNDILKKIKLVYEYTKSNVEHPMIVSFFIKEKIKFKIEISDDEMNITNRIINYKENIIIKPKPGKTYNILITPNEEEEGIINSTMIINIIQGNSTSIHLQKNQLNSGFIPKNIDYYYYYMDISKGEEGEIVLFNKRQNGILMSKIIPWVPSIPGVDAFPKYNENNLLSSDYSKFSIYNQKLSFNSSYTERCEYGCFLLITYYSNISKSLEINGTEFSILSRIWDKEELKSQIINIPLNEYIFGDFDETNINIHYYSIFIPFDTDNIFIELHGMNILGYSQEGIVQINTSNITSNTKKLFDKFQNKIIIKLNKKDIGLDSIKGKYISFAFEKDNKDIGSYYYFRILQKNPENNYIIYPLDTNKENLCETYDNKCYFLLKNEYNVLSNKIVIYGYGKNDISYKVFYMNDTDYYSSNLNLNHLNEINEIESLNGRLILDIKTDEPFILIEIKSNSKENEILTILSSFYTQQNLSSIDIYSYQLFHLSENGFQQYYLNQNSSIKYRILINNTEGEGYINFNQAYNNNNNNFIHLTEQKIYSFSIPKKTSFMIYAKNNLLYNIKIIYDISNEAIKELNYQYNLETIDLSKTDFPLFYFIKDVKYNGININFDFKFDDSNNNLIIKGYGLDYSEIAFIKDKNNIQIKNFLNEIKGKYDNITNSGTIELSNELLKTKYNGKYKYLDDKYYMIIIENNITSFNFKNLRNDIYVFSKDENYILLPINKYIRNSFDLLENKDINQKYFFEKENIANNEFILEFSSNYKSIELEFNNKTNFSNPNIIGGFKQYILSIESNNSNDYYFNIIIKPISQINLEKSLKEVNIIIKYYNEGKIKSDYICNKTSFNLAEYNDKEKNSGKILIINNMYEINNHSNDLNYSYYLRLIKNNDVLLNEELNTTALISSNISFINKFETIQQNFYIKLNNLKNNEKYIALLFIKVENEEEEKYYSMTYEFLTELEDQEHEHEQNTTNNSMIILIFIIILIIVFILFFIICRRMRIKSRSLEDKVNDTDFSSGLNNDLVGDKELSDKVRTSGSYLNSFI